MAHELDLTDCDLPPCIAIENLINGFIDAGNYEDASLAILAHPASLKLDQRSLRKLWEIGNRRRAHTRVDRKMIDALADFVEAAEGVTWSN